jgi:hypothetical protein
LHTILIGRNGPRYVIKQIRKCPIFGQSFMILNAFLRLKEVYELSLVPLPRHYFPFSLGGKGLGYIVSEWHRITNVVIQFTKAMTCASDHVRPIWPSRLPLRLSYICWKCVHKMCKKHYSVVGEWGPSPTPSSGPLFLARSNHRLVVPNLNVKGGVQKNSYRTSGSYVYLLRLFITYNVCHSVVMNGRDDDDDDDRCLWRWGHHYAMKQRTECWWCPWVVVILSPIMIYKV